MSWIRILFCLQFLIGVGAVPAGFALIINPSGANLGLPLELLQGSPFGSYLIPGIVLFSVIGVGNIAGGILTLRRKAIAGEFAAVSGVLLMVWIIVQVLIIPFHWLQPLYFILGLMVLILGRVVRKQLNQKQVIKTGESS